MPLLEITSDHASQVSLLGGESVVLTSIAGDTLYYAASPTVSSASHDGTLAVGGSVTVTQTTWLRSASHTSVSGLWPTASDVEQDASGSYTVGGKILQTTGASGVFDVTDFGAKGDTVYSNTATCSSSNTTYTDPNLKPFSGTKTIVISGAGTNPGGGSTPYGFKTTLTCTVAGTGTLGATPTSSVAPVNCVQTLTQTGSPTGGTFTLTFNGFTTTSLAYNCAASDVQTALVALFNIGPGEVVCAGGPLNTTPITVTFQNAFGSCPMDLLQVVKALTGGSTPTVTVTTATAGVSGIAVYGTDDTTAIQNAINAAAQQAALSGQQGIVSGRASAAYLVPFAGPTINYGPSGFTSVTLALQIKNGVKLKGLNLYPGDYRGSVVYAVGDVLAGASQWAVEDCIINGSAPGPAVDNEYGHGAIIMGSSTQASITGNLLTQFRQSCLQGIGNAPSTNVKITDNEMSLFYGGAIKPEGTGGYGDWWIERNFIHDNYNTWSNGGGAECIFMNSTTAGTYLRVKIKDNTIANAGSSIVPCSGTLLEITGNHLESQKGGTPIANENGGILQSAVITGNTVGISNINGFNLSQAVQCDVSHNTFYSLPGSTNFPSLIADGAGASANLYLDNNYAPNNISNNCRYVLTSLTAGTRLRHGVGSCAQTYPATPSVPASTTQQQNSSGMDQQVFLVGGTVSDITITFGGYQSGTHSTGLSLTSGQTASLILKANDYITLTYTVAPTWVWIPYL